MMTSSNGNVFRVTGLLCGEFTSPGEFPTQRPVTRSFDFSLICVWINGWVNNREAGDLRRNRGHYDVIVMELWWILHTCDKHHSNGTHLHQQHTLIYIYIYIYELSEVWLDVNRCTFHIFQWLYSLLTFQILAGELWYLDPWQDFTPVLLSTIR